MNNKSGKSFISVDLQSDNKYMDKINSKLNELINLNTALNVIFSLKMIDENDFLIASTVLFEKLDGINNEIESFLRADDLQIPIKKISFFG